MRYTGPYNRKTRPRPRSRLNPYLISRQEYDLPLHCLTRAKMRANSPNIAASDKQERPHIGEQKSEDRRLQPTLADMSRHKSTLRIKSRGYRSTEARARKPCDPVIIMPIQPRGPAGIASISANTAAGNHPPEKKKKCDIWGHLGTYGDICPTFTPKREGFGPIGQRRRTTAISVRQPCKLCDRRRNEPRSICEVERVGTLGFSGEFV